MGCTPCEEAARQRRELDEAKAAKRAERERDAALVRGEVRAPSAPSAAARAKATAKQPAAKRATAPVGTEPPPPRASIPANATVTPRDPRDARVASGQPRQHRFSAPLDTDGAPIITAVPRVRPPHAAPPRPVADGPHAPADTAGGAAESP